MRALRSREVPVATAIELLESELGRAGLVATIADGGRGGVVRCELRDSAGNLMADAGGYGGPNATASAMFEAWQHHCHRQGFNSMRFDPRRMRVMKIEEIISQPPLDGDAMLHRMARDCPRSFVGCLRYDPLFNADAELWYPAFARFPWCRQYPIPGECGYAPYQRYATATGTAAGVSGAEALLHALLEVIEGDAVSLALLDWYADDRTAPRQVAPDVLPGDLQERFGEAESVIGCVPLILDISTDLGVPAFIAVPSRGECLGNGGEGASLIPGYAVERALGELMQAHRWLADHRGHRARLRRVAANLGKWPVLQRCMTLDPVALADRAEPAWRRPARWWDEPDLDVAGQFAELSRVVSAAGYQGYCLRWSPPALPIPVVTVLVPGLETFSLVRQGVPVLPSGRGMSRLAAR